MHYIIGSYELQVKNKSSLPEKTDCEYICLQIIAGQQIQTV